MKPQIFWLTLFIFITGGNRICGQTLIFVRRTDAQIIIAADSRTTKTVTDSNGIKIVAPDTTCKIQKFGRFFIVAAGAIKSEVLNYDIYKIAKNFFGEENNIFITTKKIEKHIMDPLTYIAKQVSVSDPQKFKGTYGNGGILQLGIFGIQSDTLVACIRVYKATKDVRNNVIVFKDRNRSGDFRKGRLSTQFGLFSIIEDSLKTHKRVLRNFKDPIPTMIKLIELAIERDKTNSVGKPINVIRIRKTGHEWIDPKPPCAKQ